MMTAKTKLPLFLVLGGLSLALAGCATWQGSETVSTDVGGDAEGHGPGLFTGKEGGIVLYNEVWTGAAPGGSIAE